MYQRARAIQLRYLSSDRHVVIDCIKKLMTAKMTEETVYGAHTFTDEISALIQRLKGHLRDGRLDVLTVMEIMVLIGGLPKSEPFALIALACSTDESLTAAQFVERLHRQSERLARVLTQRLMMPILKAVMQPQLKGIEVKVSSKRKSDHVNPTGKGNRRDIHIYRHIGRISE